MSGQPRRLTWRARKRGGGPRGSRARGGTLQGELQEGSSPAVGGLRGRLPSAPHAHRRPEARAELARPRGRRAERPRDVAADVDGAAAIRARLRDEEGGLSFIPPTAPSASRVARACATKSARAAPYTRASAGSSAPGARPR